MLVVVALGLGGLAAWTLTARHQAGASTSTMSTTRPPLAPQSTTTTQPTPRAHVHVARLGPPKGVSLVARLPHNELGYDKPGGKVVRIVPGEWYGIPSMLLVMERESGWLLVRLAQRPNETTSWIKSRGIKLSLTDYSIVVNLKTTHLELFKLGKRIGDYPAGVGAPSDPTPTGHYFVAFDAPPPAGQSYLYGPFILYLSAHSNAIADWEGTGDAIIAIHGPIGADAEIGTRGTYISHGCIRLHIPDLLKLGIVPPGTPVDIID
jgi:hypothetical protein